MIGNVIGMGCSFHSATAYNLRGHNNSRPDKCAWSDVRNLPGADPELGATMMEATARRSRRVNSPVFHFSIDWHPNEGPTEEQSRKASEAVLSKLGLGDYQAMVFCHQDAAHPHVHLVVNRVHPETGKAWPHWKSKERLEAAVRETARELGFWAIEGRDAKTERPDRSTYRRRQRRAERTGLDSDPWGSLKRIEEVFAAHEDLPVQAYVSGVRAYRSQLYRTQGAQRRLHQAKEARDELRGKTRSAMWSGVAQVLRGRSARRADSQAKQLTRNIAQAEARVTKAQESLAVENAKLGMKRSQLQHAKSRVGDKDSRQVKKARLVEALDKIAPSDLLGMKMPRRERQRLAALLRSNRSKDMALHQSSALLMLDRKRKGQHLQRLNANSLEREEEMHTAIADLEDYKKQLAEARNAVDNRVKGAEKILSAIEKKISEQYIMIGQCKQRYADAKELVRTVSDELADLELKWYDAREREKSERGRER